MTGSAGPLTGPHWPGPNCQKAYLVRCDKESYLRTPFYWFKVHKLLIPIPLINDEDTDRPQVHIFCYFYMDGKTVIQIC